MPESRYLEPELDVGENIHDKKVSAHAMTRLSLAADAIGATKRAIAHQGNQVPSLKATQMNSYQRMRVMRTDELWEYTPEAKALAAKNKEADVAARADIAHGGNCGEHAYVAFHYLREHAAGEPINYMASVIDHAFVIIGDLKNDAANEMSCATRVCPTTRLPSRWKWSATALIAFI
jgi:hypothetical protein